MKTKQNEKTTHNLGAVLLLVWCHLQVANTVAVLDEDTIYKVDDMLFDTQNVFVSSRKYVIIYLKSL